MSRKGYCWDNAVAESLFGSLKKERAKKHIYNNREVAVSDISDYIESLLQSLSTSQRSKRHEPGAVRSSIQTTSETSPVDPGNSSSRPFQQPGRRKAPEAAQSPIPSVDFRPFG